MRSMTGEGECGWTALIRLPPATTFSREREKGAPLPADLGKIRHRMHSAAQG